jgi:hypothetical protein
MNNTIIKGQYKILRINFIPYQHRNNPVFYAPLNCENMVSFNIANEFGTYITITVNGQLKIRSLKKILKYHFSKEGEWPIFDLYDDNLFNADTACYVLQL